MPRIFVAVVGSGLIIGAGAAGAVTPTTQATATTRVYRPLTISSVQNLNFGTVVLSGTGSWSGEVVSISQAGALTCGTSGNVTCSGTPLAAQYKLVGTNNAVVAISSPPFNLTNGANTLAFTPNAPATVNLGGSGSSTGFTFGIGGSITLASTTVDGVYSGTFLVTANYQ